LIWADAYNAAFNTTIRLLASASERPGQLRPIADDCSARSTSAL
jgi:hypothetical protein